MRGERGFALIITLVVTALLVALTVEFISEVYVATAAGRTFVDAEQAGMMAESGMQGAMVLLQRELAGKSYSSLQDRWAKPLELADERGILTVTAEEESGKLNLNLVTLPNGTLHPDYYPIALRLFRKLGLSADLLDALADWLDQDDVPHPGGAETGWYTARKPPYAAKNGSLGTLEELLLIKGFDRPVIDKLRPFVTVYGPQTATPINVNTAPKEIIAAIDKDMTDDLADRVLDYRKNNPFKENSALGNVPGMEKIGQGLATLTTVSGTVYRLRAEARVNEASRVIEAVVRTSGGPSTVLYWREY